MNTSRSFRSKVPPKLQRLAQKRRRCPKLRKSASLNSSAVLKTIYSQKKPLYIHAQDKNGKNLIFPKEDEEGTRLEDMPPIGPDFTDDGVRVSDLRSIFAPGELRSFKLVLKYVLETDGRAINDYQPEAGAPGPNGMMCYVLQHKNNSAYSTERKVDGMEQDPPPPPPRKKTRKEAKVDHPAAQLTNKRQPRRRPPQAAIEAETNPVPSKDRGKLIEAGPDPPAPPTVQLLRCS
jgi:hypothetical protein